MLEKIRAAGYVNARMHRNPSAEATGVARTPGHFYKRTT
jgi:hypothetical protein